MVDMVLRAKGGTLGHVSHASPLLPQKKWRILGWLDPLQSMEINFAKMQNDCIIQNKLTTLRTANRFWPRFEISQYAVYARADK